MPAISSSAEPIFSANATFEGTELCNPTNSYNPRTINQLQRMQTAHKMLQKYCVKIKQRMTHIMHKYTSIIPLDLYDDNSEIDRRASHGCRREPRILETVITLLFKHQAYCYYYHHVMVLFDQILKYNNGYKYVLSVGLCSCSGCM
eukprot:205113_1